MEKSQQTTSKLTLFALTWPIFVEILLHMLMGNVNTMMLGKYSDDAVAAVGVATQVIGILIVIFGFVATGTSILVSQYLGAQQHTEARAAAVTAITLNTLFGVVMSLLVVFSAEALLGWMRLPDALMSLALEYTTIVGIFLFFEAVMMTVSAIARAHGHTKWVMYVTLGMNVVNVFGCWLALYQPFGLPSFGVTGVAVAIVVSRLIGLIGVLLILNWKVQMKLTIKGFLSPPTIYVRNLLRIGVPSAGEHMAYHTSQLMITYFVTIVGALALTTKVYVQNVGLFLFLFSAAVGMGTQIIVGHMVGARQMQQAYQRCLRSLKIALAISIVVSLIFTLAAPHLFALFTENAEIIQLASIVMALTMLLEPGRCFNLVIINSLKAAGDTKFPVIMGVISMWGISVPLAWYLGIYMDYGLIGIYIAFIVDEWLRGLIMFWRWRSRVWEQMSFV
jgi:putative MATE family efflux protein